MRRKAFTAIGLILGVLLIAAGLIMFRLYRAADSGQVVMLAVPGVCLGIGSGLFGRSLSELISCHEMKKDPELRKRVEIEENDERNIAVTRRAKARAYDLMLGVFGALMLCFALMGVPVAAVLLLVGAYLLVTGMCVYWQIKYNEEM